MDTMTTLRGALSRAQLMNLATTLLIGLLLAWQHHIDYQKVDELLSTGILGFLWCVLVTIMVAGDRYSELELSLPLSGRTIWKDHVAATVVLSMIHIVVFILPIAITGTPYARGQYLSIGGHVLAGLILLGSLIHWVKPGLSALYNRNWAVCVGLLVMWQLVKIRSPWLSMLAVAVAGLILLRAGRKVKETLTLADDRSGQEGGYASLGRWEPSVADGRTGTPVILRAPAAAGRCLTTLWMLGTMNLKQFSSFFQGTSFAILMLLGGALATPDAGVRTVSISILGTFVVLKVLSPELIRSGSPYAHLPIPRRRLHAGLLLPVFVAVGFCALAQIAINLTTGTNPGLVRAVEWVEKGMDPYYTITVPPRFHRIAQDGRPPVVAGRNGETYTPVAQIRRSADPGINGPVIYNPYEVDRRLGHRSSAAFATGQYIRAVKEIYGVDLDREQAKRLISEHNGSLETLDGLSIAGTPQRTAIGIVLFSTVWALLGTLFSLFTRLVRPARFERWRNTFRAPAVIAAAMVLTAIVMTIRISAESSLWFEYYTAVMTTRLTQMMPGAFLSLTMALICLAGAFLLSQELFARRQALPGGAKG